MIIQILPTSLQSLSHYAVRYRRVDKDRKPSLSNATTTNIASQENGCSEAGQKLPLPTISMAGRSSLVLHHRTSWRKKRVSELSVCCIDSQTVRVVKFV